MLRMPPFVSRISMPPGGWPDRYAFSFDHPQQAAELQALTVNFRGFVVPKDAAAGLPRHLVFCVDGIEVARAPIDRSRPDLAQSAHAPGAARMNHACGFDTVLPSFLAPEGEAVLVCIEVVDTDAVAPRRIPLAEFRFDGGVAAERHDGIGVVTINSIGRSGSSLLCRLLSLHPQAHVPVFGGQYGEVTVAGHLAATIAVMASEGAPSAVNRVYGEPDYAMLPHGYTGMDEQDGGHERRCRHELAQAALRGGLLAMRQSLDAMTRLARAHKPGATWWVEKNWGSSSAPLLGALARDWRELVLVRDPRDYLRSQMRYLHELGLPRQELLAHAEVTPEKFRRLYASYRSRRARVKVLRYEDLLGQPRESLGAVAEYLRLAAPKRFVDRAVRLLGKDDDFRRRLASDGMPPSAELEALGLPSVDVSALGPWFQEMCQEFGYPVPDRLTWTG